MREIKVQEITAAVSKLCKDSCYYLPEELLEKLKASIATEESPLGQEILTTIVENAELAKAKDVPICQDTGLTVVFMEIGQEVHFVGGDLYEASTSVSPMVMLAVICVNLLLMILYLYVKIPVIIRRRSFIQR
mgnify:CR=1 FL=1